MKYSVAEICELFEYDILNDIDPDRLIEAHNYLCEELFRNPDQRIIDSDEFRYDLDRNLTAEELLDHLLGCSADLSYGEPDYWCYDHKGYEGFTNLDYDEAIDAAMSLLYNWGMDIASEHEECVQEVIEILHIEYEIVEEDDDSDDEEEDS